MSEFSVCLFSFFFITISLSLFFSLHSLSNLSQDFLIISFSYTHTISFFFALHFSDFHSVFLFPFLTLHQSSLWMSLILIFPVFSFSFSSFLISLFPFFCFFSVSLSSFFLFLSISLPSSWLPSNPTETTVSSAISRVKHYRPGQYLDGGPMIL